MLSYTLLKNIIISTKCRTISFCCKTYWKYEGHQYILNLEDTTWVLNLLYSIYNHICVCVCAHIYMFVFLRITLRGYPVIYMTILLKEWGLGVCGKSGLNPPPLCTRYDPSYCLLSLNLNFLISIMESAISY